MAKFEAKKAVLIPQTTVEAYVPNRDRNGALVHNHEHWVRIVEQAVCELTGGGCTTYEARGCWRGSYEQTTVVRGATAGSEYGALVQALGAFAEETNQELAGFTADGQWFWCVEVGA